MNEIYSSGNLKIYYSLMLIVISFMISGVVFAYPRSHVIDLGYPLHIGIVLILSVGLMIYPKFYDIPYFRIFMILLISVYFYLIFFLYPETLSTFILICLIPAISIFFFDKHLFYFTLVVNLVVILGTFAYVIWMDISHVFPGLEQDVVGNIINFIASQFILYILFVLTNFRMKKQQLYYEKVQQAERLKTSGQLAAAVAHEIRNPLTVVKGFLDLYKNDRTINKDMKKHFNLMVEELETAEHVISSFLSVTKPNTEKVFELIDLKETLNSVVELLHSYGLNNDNKIQLYVEEDCYIFVNKIEFKQLLINIIKNSIEASKNGDSITVTAKRLSSCVEVKVFDTGCGMSEEEVKLLGTPFYSLKSKGTGLGMMICFDIVKSNNGTISFESSKGIGTTVTVRFKSQKI